MANRKELVLEVTHEGCHVPTSHKLNEDGYFRRRFKRGDENVFMMYHRYAWLVRHDEQDIPAGHEVDHSCGNRACCNPDHLVLRSRNDHLVDTNQRRQQDRLNKARLTWANNPSIDRVELSSMFDVDYNTAKSWLRTFEAELHY